MRDVWGIFALTGVLFLWIIILDWRRKDELSPTTISLVAGLGVVLMLGYLYVAWME